MHRLCVIFIVAVSLLALQGCVAPCQGSSCNSTDGGGNAVGGGSGGGTVNSPELQFCLDARLAALDLQARCGFIDPSALPNERSRSEEDCRHNGFTRELQEGRAGLVPSGVSACLSSAYSLSCTDLHAYFFTSSYSCLEGVAGLSEANCFTDSDCVPTRFCDTSNTCPGRCTPKTAIGQPVTAQGECVSGAENYQGVCTALVAEGGDCGSTTSTNHRCVPGADCDPLTKICRAWEQLPAVGQSCNVGGPVACALGLQCVSGSCVPLVVKGGTCDSARECQKGLFCSSTNVCMPLLAAGTSCDSSVPSGQCQHGAQCLGGTCRPTSNGLDADCSQTGCASGLYCSPAGTCKAKGGEGAACDSNQPCLSIYYCSGGTCTKRKANGESCTATGSPLTTTEACLGSRCETGTCTGTVYCTEY